MDVAGHLPEVIADAGLLERVIANVVQNALRYAPAGTPTRLAGSAHGDTVQLRVIDRGPETQSHSASAIALRSFVRVTLATPSVSQPRPTPRRTPWTVSDAEGDRLRCGNFDSVEMSEGRGRLGP